MSVLADALVRWQRVHGRHALPWQGSRDPYRVWLSEIMLQQTQVSTVLGYYDRFLARFPDVAALAAAPLDEVLALWSGLGYYRRARMLHACAQAVVAHHGGRFPAGAEALEALPGIGRSTAAAIAAFCHDERVAILDGNVRRVLARALAFEGDPSQGARQRELWDRATDLLPRDRQDMPAYTQGLMDLGATVCTPRQPDCGRCPWASMCAAHRLGRETDFPAKVRRAKRSARTGWCLWIEAPDGAVWLHRRPAEGVWAGLWAWPMFDDEAALRAAARAVSPQADAGLRLLPPQVHVLTHLDWTLHPCRLVLPDAPAGDPPGLAPGRWWPRADLGQAGLPAPLRRWLQGPGPAEVAPASTSADLFADLSR